MIQQILENPETLIGALIFAFIFFAGPRWRINLESQKGYRRVVSFNAGIAIAYVFIRILPELSEANEIVLEYTQDIDRLFSQHWVYGASLLGFVLFYGIGYIVTAKRSPSGSEEAEDPTEKIRFIVTIVAYSLYATQ